MKPSKPERTDTVVNRYRILLELNKPSTANEIIDRIFDNDYLNRNVGSWKYYVHLNKLFSPLEKAGEIEQVGIKRGPTNKIEKVWSLT